MKNLLFAIFAFISFATFSQKPQLHIDSFYVDKTEFLIYESVIEVDSVKVSDLNTRVKNWAGTAFVNMEQVLVSETETQLVFNYIVSFEIKTLGMVTVKDWYIRMVVQFKDGKVRVRQFDDGNAFWPGSYSGGVSVPATQARRYKFSDYFNKENLSGKSYTEGLQKVKSNCLSMSVSMEKSIKVNPASNKTEEDGW